MHWWQTADEAIIFKNLGFKHSDRRAVAVLEFVFFPQIILYLNYSLCEQNISKMDSPFPAFSYLFFWLILSRDMKDKVLYSDRKIYVVASSNTSSATDPKVFGNFRLNIWCNIKAVSQVYSSQRNSQMSHFTYTIYTSHTPAH